MKSRVPIKPLLYIFLTVGFFLVLVLMDRLFGFHYEPVDHEHNLKVSHEPAQSAKSKGNTHKGEESKEHTVFTESEDSTPTKSDEEKSIEKKETSSNPESAQAYFDELMSNYQKNVISRLDKNKSRTDIVIRYYHHEPDGKSAYALGKLRYYIHEREVDQEYLNYQSNAIFYGDSVSLDDVQIVSYTLITHGLPVKLIKPSKFHDSWKAHSIEIGTDTTVLQHPTITLEELKNLKL